MARFPDLVSPAGAERSILGLGVVYLLLAFLQAGRELVTGNEALDAVNALLLVGIPGSLILLGGRRLGPSDVRPEIYPRVLGWAMAGFGLLLLVVGLRVTAPGATIDQPLRSATYATAIGTAAGLGIGIYEGQAISRARVAEERSQELQATKAELEETVQRLRELNARLEQFAFAASHDLKEPLRMVSLYLQLLEERYEDQLDEDAIEYIGYAVGGAERLRKMLESLLEYSRVTTGGGRRAPVDANDALDEALDTLALRIEETEADIAADELPTVMAEPDQLSAVFRHLLSNAMTYSGDHPPRIRIWAEPSDGMWRFAVHDEGIGIDPAYHDKAFEAFERLSSEDETAEPGTGGIGLALCRRIVEHHGGEIWVESERGQGSTFYFTVPRRERGAGAIDDREDPGRSIRA